MTHDKQHLETEKEPANTPLFHFDPFHCVGDAYDEANDNKEQDT